MLTEASDRLGLAEAGDVAVGPCGVLRFIPPVGRRLAAPLAEGVDDAAEVGIEVRVAHAVGQHAFAVVAAGKHAQRAGLHRAELAGVDEERLALAVPAAVLEVPAGLAAGEEPEAGGDAGGQEELGRQRDDAVHQVGLDDALADVALAAGAGGERAVGHDEAGDSAAVPVRRGQMVDEVLDPGVVGVAEGRRAVAPAHIVA